MPGLTPYPPFPQDVSTSPLFVIDYELIKAGDAGEIERLRLEGCDGDGVLAVVNITTNRKSVPCLTNHEEAEGMFAMGEKAIVTLEEKLLFEQGDHGVSFGYKADKGTRDVPEFVNKSKDDALAWPAVARRTYSSAVNARMESTIAPFVKKSLAISNHLIGVLNDTLGLPRVSAQGRGVQRMVPPLEEKTFLAAHTDSGSLWFYVKVGDPSLSAALMLTQSSVAQPLPGHATCNIGDALNIVSGGILRSNIHRVVPPPREQAQYERHSVVFFTRPNDVVELRVLSGQSERIAAAVAYAPPGKYAPGVTAMEWLVRRVKSQRVTNYKDPDSWTDRRGTEDTAIPSQGKI
ncbi:Clavaminate synthase-like protein [Epithele typhae]|uniref:Clavaminate synthase-like protein n=1 Tax=Epithele typhae TaxID=378194 RepID=UPI0020085D22|nr:Clavaminate synthase-like protein [Epithele typhae]KAH9936748.1 Clavaminate synthase-like protein [Epithele typhae]